MICPSTHFLTTPSNLNYIHCEGNTDWHFGLFAFVLLVYELFLLMFFVCEVETHLKRFFASVKC